MKARPLSAAELARAREGDSPVVLFDIRDPVEAERGHVPGATNLPRRRLEFRIAELVADPATPIVVCGDADERARLAAGTLEGLGYADVAWLEGGIEAWMASGRSLATGNNVPSKTFGEQVQHGRDVPSIDAETFLRWRAEGRRMAVCDVRTPGEHQTDCIPGSVSAPSFDVALHAADLAAAHDTVVLHCAGRTRSIIGTQTLAEMGLDKVVALENGTMGWRLAGHELEQGSKRALGEPSAASREAAERSAARLAEAAGVRRMQADELAALLQAPRRNRHVFDVRSLQEHLAGHIAGSIALPGGQVVQRADDFIAVRQAPIVLIDEGEARAHLTGTWLRRMGFPEVAVLAGGVAAWRAAGRALVPGRERHAPLGWDEARAAVAGLSAPACEAWLADHPDGLVLDVDSSVHFRQGHLARAQWLPRSRLELRIDALAGGRERPLLLSCADGAQSVYAAATLRRMGFTAVTRLEGGTRAWAAAGLALQTAELPPQDDELLAPYQRGEQAMRDYIDWEKLLAAGGAAVPSVPAS